MLGGNGYVEESVLPRLYREAPLNSIWEGAGNVSASTCCAPCARPGAIEAFLDELAAARGADPRLDAARDELARDLAAARSRCAPAASSSGSRSRCRARFSSVTPPHAVADAFCASRLGGEGGRAFGTLPRGVDCAAIVERHRPRA